MMNQNYWHVKLHPAGNDRFPSLTSLRTFRKTLTTGGYSLKTSFKIMVTCCRNILSNYSYNDIQYQNDSTNLQS